jgi:hypothetical protein
MDADNAHFRWLLCQSPLGFELDCPTPSGTLPIFFSMAPMEARGLVLALGLVPEVAALLRPEVVEWLRKRAAGECAADQEFLRAAGIEVQPQGECK